TRGLALRLSDTKLMALDHYVSQVYLKNFYSPALDGLVYAIRKSDLKRFPTKSQDVCRIEEGSTNAYLTKDRAIEEFLKEVEPRYNASLCEASKVPAREIRLAMNAALAVGPNYR